MTRRPFLKWAGGKTHLIPTLRALVPSGARRLVEPFVGSVAVALNLGFESALLGDINADLISLFQIVCRDPRRFIAACAREFTPPTNAATAYALRRAEFNATRDPLRRAVLFVYLNRHGYNGLCRYNRHGHFNVPFGRHARPYFPHAELLHFTRLLRRASFVQADFRVLMAQAVEGDFVYCDPPYAPPAGRTRSFTTYAAGGFSAQDQCDLADAARGAAQRGACVVISNHDSPLTRALYRDAAEIRRLTMPRSISRRTDRRTPACELLAIYAPRATLKR